MEGLEFATLFYNALHDADSDVSSSVQNMAYGGFVTLWNASLSKDDDFTMSVSVKLQLRCVGFKLLTLTDDHSRLRDKLSQTIDFLSYTKGKDSNGLQNPDLCLTKDCLCDAITHTWTHFIQKCTKCENEKTKLILVNSSVDLYVKYMNFLIGHGLHEHISQITETLIVLISELPKLPGSDIKPSKFSPVFTHFSATVCAFKNAVVQHKQSDKVKCDQFAGLTEHVATWCNIVKKVLSQLNSTYLDVCVRLLNICVTIGKQHNITFVKIDEFYQTMLHFYDCLSAVRDALLLALSEKSEDHLEETENNAESKLVNVMEDRVMTTASKLILQLSWLQNAKEETGKVETAVDGNLFPDNQ